MFEGIPVGVDVDTVVELNSIDETTTAFTRKIGKLREMVDEKRQQIRARRQGDLERAGLVSNEDGRRVVDKDRRRAEIDFVERGIEQETRRFREELAASSQAERDAMLASLQAKLTRLDAIASAFPSPTAYLARHGLGSTEHANLVTTLAGAGKAELTARAQQAVLSGNKILASAIVTVVDRLPRRDRPFASIDLATRLVGDEHNAQRERIDEARRRVRAALDLNRLFEHGEESPNAKIARGVATRRATS